MRGYLFPTDFNWFTFLRERQPLDEVNFWRPSGRGFAALSPGEPLLFKLKSPHNAIGGFGLFARYEQATARLAWDAFGERNGATTFDEMCRRIEHYRAGQPNDPLRRYQVGCIMLSQPVFFADGDWVPQPTDWAPRPCPAPATTWLGGGAPRLAAVPGTRAGYGLSSRWSSRPSR